jgi:membrane fusion protein (multidrug efflux system)
MSQRRYRPLIIAVVVLGLIGSTAYVYWSRVLRGVVSTDDARLAATMVDVSPDIPGKLVEVEVGEGDKVEAGEVLFRLDARDIEAQITAVEARIPTLEAQVHVAEAQQTKAESGTRPEQIRVAQAAVHRLETAADGAAAELDRARKLFTAGAGTQQAVANAQTRSDLAARSLDEARERLRLLRHGTRSEDIDAADAGLEAAHAAVAAAKAERDRARLNLEHTVVKAPFDGVVVRTWREAGENASPASPVVTLLEPQSLHVNANIEETDLSEVHEGDQATMEVDAFPGVQLRGHIGTILDATTSQFSLLPSEGASGAFIKVTQRVPVRVDLDELPGRDEHLYAPGLSVQLHILSGTGGR